MSNSPNKDVGFSIDGSSGRNDDGYNKDTLMLNPVESLDKEGLTTHFVANRKTRCIEAKLNHVYSGKIIISRVYPDWIKTVNNFVMRGVSKGISNNHIEMLTDTLDSNYEKVLQFVYGDQVTDRVNPLELVNNKVVDLFLDETKKPYAAIKIDNHVETMPIESNRFEDWIGGTYYDYQKDTEMSPSTLSKEAISKIQSVLRYKAASSIPVQDNSSRHQNIRTLYVRVAAFVDPEANLDDNVIYYDLCNLEWEIIKITRRGWEITKQDGQKILFKRFVIMNQQVYPRRDYPHDILHQFLQLVNIDDDDEDNRILAIVYIIALFLLADLPKPMLNPNGPHGSGKSTYQEYVKLIVDPAAAFTTAFPDSLAELVQILSHSYVTFFDNVSGIKEVTSDQLCRVSNAFKRIFFVNVVTKIQHFFRRLRDYNKIRTD